MICSSLCRVPPADCPLSLAEFVRLRPDLVLLDVDALKYALVRDDDYERVAKPKFFPTGRQGRRFTKSCAPLNLAWRFHSVRMHARSGASRRDVSEGCVSNPSTLPCMIPAGGRFVLVISFVSVP